MDAIYIMYNNWAFSSVLFLIFLLCFHFLNDNFHSNNCPQTSVQLPGYPKCLAQKLQMLGTQTTVQLNSPQNQDRIINVGLYTHSRNCSLPHSESGPDIVRFSDSLALPRACGLGNLTRPDRATDNSPI
jgi:hypothetical protein